MMVMRIGWGGEEIGEEARKNRVMKRKMEERMESDGQRMELFGWLE